MLSFPAPLTPICPLLTMLSLTEALYTYEGSDEPDVAGGRPYENVLSNNVVTNCPVGVKIKAGDDNVLAGESYL